MAPIRQSPVILYLIITLGIVTGFLYQSQLDPSADVPAIDPKFTTSLRDLENLSIDYGILSDSRISSLRVFGELPVQPSGGGTDNPFR